jgi:hypothetical protein
MRLRGALLTSIWRPPTFGPCSLLTRDCLSFGSPSLRAGLSLLELAADAGAEHLGELLGLLVAPLRTAVAELLVVSKGGRRMWRKPLSPLHSKAGKAPKAGIACCANKICGTTTSPASHPRVQKEKSAHHLGHGCLWSVGPPSKAPTISNIGWDETFIACGTKSPSIVPGRGVRLTRESRAENVNLVLEIRRHERTVCVASTRGPSCGALIDRANTFAQQLALRRTCTCSLSPWHFRDFGISKTQSQIATTDCTRQSRIAIRAPTPRI